ncbi:MAG: tail fiber domain-containing protein [Coprococcus sp.]|nr:tail fiber domain-containing protein [Coprococcus sp.]
MQKQPYNIIKIDKYTNKIQMPNLLLMTRSFDVIGKISNYSNWNISLVGNGMDEISFEVNKYINGVLCPIWNDLIDLKIVDVMGFGRFEISVNYTDNTQTVKSVHGISLETELAQIPLYEFHVNDDDAMTMEKTNYNKDDFDEYGNFIPTVFYREILLDDTPEEAKKKRKHSLLHRVLADKAPHWHIGSITSHITFSEDEQPESVETFQRTYTCDGTSIYDFLTGEVAKESNVIFTFDTINREINCYSLCDCIDQETGKILAKGIGEDTNILVSKNKLANEITISSNKENVKNCFRIEGGDDVITDMVRVVNMNGTNYIYQFADFQYNDMPEALKSKIQAYQKIMSSQEVQDKYYGNGDMSDFINGTLTLFVTSETEAATVLNICKNNKIVTNNTKISDYADTPYWYIVTSNNAKELYLSKTQKSPYKSVENTFNTMGIYTRLCEKYDELSYFESSMMPEVFISETTAEEQYNIVVDELTKSDMTVGVSSLNNYNDNLFAGISNNIEAMANILIDARYNAEVIKDSASFGKNEKDEYIWTGNIQITRAADDTDCYPKNNTEAYQNTIHVKVSDDELTFTKQKIEKALSKGSMLDIDFDIDTIWNDAELALEKKSEKIREYFNLYSLTRLKSFYDGYNSCLSILMSLPDTSSVRQELYNKYCHIMQIISNPPTTENPNPVPGVLDIRKAQVKSLNTEIENITKEQKAFPDKYNLNLHEYLGDDLYIEFCKYRREDSYTNNNYISDGLSTSECLVKAKELVEATTKEAKKACVLQRTVSTSLNNLFALPEFEQLYDKFALFNYIRIRTEDEILKLRLIGVEFNGDSVSDINVTFSEQIESIDGKTDDLTSIIQQAGNMATSFPSTALQAKKGAEANNTVSEIYNVGLNASKAMLTNNDSNEVTVTSSGIICKRMDDEGYYGDKQLRLTGNMLAFTKDAWKNVSLAIGETTFTNPITNETENAYGIIAENIVGKLIASENMYIGNKDGSVQITGEGITISNGVIKSANYSPDKKTGSIIDLTDGNFSFAGDKLVWNGENLSISGDLSGSSGVFKGEVIIENGNDGLRVRYGNDNSIKFVDVQPRGIRFWDADDKYIKSISSVTNDICIGCGADTDPDNYPTVSRCHFSLNGYTIISGEELFLSGRTSITATREISISSDKRLKTNISSINSKLIDAYMNVNPVCFNWKDNDSKIQLGVIAQNVIQAFRNNGLDYTQYGIIETNNMKNEKESYSIVYNHLNILTMKLVQNHEQQIKELNKEIDYLKSEISQYKSMLLKEV